ncbi:ABC transporter ATP-binding protein [Patescibacteria group bacterium]|nr:ABC transporter ATP-binding protein [Patescibacteria group bacterium]
MNKFKKVIWYFLPFLKKYQYMVIGTFIFYGCAAVLSGIVTPIIYKNIINALSKVDAVHALLNLFFWLAGVTVLVFILRRIGDILIIRFQARSLKNIYDFSLEKISEHAYNFFANSFVGSLVAKTKRFNASFEVIFDTLLFSFYLTALYIVGMFVVLMRENIILGLIFLVWTIVFLLVIFRLNSKKIPINLKSAEADSQVSGSLSDVLTNILNVKIFSGRVQELERFSDVTEYDYTTRYAKWRFDNHIWKVQGALLISFEIIGMGAALWLWSRGLLSTGTVVLLQIYISSLGKFLWELGKSIIRFSTAVSDSVEFVDIIEQPIQVQDRSHTEPIRMREGTISFRDISFTYPEGDHVFENFNLTIPQGQSLGVVGKSGSGKTTLTKLLLRFYDVDAGTLSIDGQNIAHVKQDDLRKMIAYIPQETILFHRSIFENIAYGNPDATNDEVIEAARAAHVHEFVEKLEHGYETKVGERGIKLSGGQRQRIGIARAMLKKNAPILVLDEATSSLDSMSEGYIQESFEQLSKNRTTIVIAHRLSTIQKMDRIIVMDHGHIIEEGSHATLLEKKGHYAALWNSQVNGFIPEE